MVMTAIGLCHQQNLLCASSASVLSLHPHLSGRNAMSAGPGMQEESSLEKITEQKEEL